MSLTPGTRLGPYEISGSLGAGGMGEVYRATDSNLKRSVAIKVLPASVAADADRLARFQREAEVLAALNHPNIAAIYGLEKTSDFTALVMELVEGDDLSQRLTKGAIPIDEALLIARQIADALEAAHEQGVIHRDLKPANIKVRPDGTVKVLDFGLAKATEPGSGMGDRGSASLSPTLTSPAMMTGVGMILGTAAYMAPEQARGKSVDKRADIWAFGAVLFEMLTGTGAFGDEDVSMTLSKILQREPDFDALPSALPARVRQVLRVCLQKDPKQRVSDIRDVRLALEGAFDTAPVMASRHRRTTPALVSALAVIAIAAVGVAAWALLNRSASGETTSVRLSIPLPPGDEITSYPAITHDGRTVAYVTQHGTDDPQLYLRDLDSFVARTVPGSRGARQPFFSPDGKWVAFFAQGQLQKAEVAGGAPIRLADAANPLGGTFTDDNTIIYAPNLGSGLLQISARGGAPTPLTKPDGAAQGYAHVFPQALPGGRRILFNIWGRTQGNAVLSLDSRQWELILPLKTFLFSTFDALRGSEGRLLLGDQSGGVRAAPFDSARPAPTNADKTVLTGVYYDVENESRPWLAVSDTRTAVYVAGNPAQMSLVWVDRAGTIESAGNDQDIYREATLSPDGTEAVVRNGLDLWIHDIQRGTKRPLTTATGANILPVWSSDGLRIVFASNRGGDWDIYSQPADGSRPAEALLKRPSDQFPYAVTSDGTLLYTEIHPNTARDLWMLSPDGKATKFRATQFNEAEGRISPGGSAGSGGGQRWIAYSSDESGRNEIYLQSYPDGTRRSAVSSGGGTQPRWSADGKELFFVTGDSVMAVAVHPDGAVDPPRRLFDRANFFLPYRFQSYAPSQDGKRFLMIRRNEGSVPRQLNVILHWGDGLDAKAQ